MNIQARVALDKVKNPERYCGDCLWALRSGPCPKHSDVLVPVDRLQAMYDAGDMSGARTAAGHRPHGARFRERLSRPLYGLLPASQAPAVHRPPLPPQMREPDGEWRPLLTGIDGGAS